MPKIIKQNLIDIILVTMLVVVSVNISVQNYTAGTWLTGWDNLHPEFNLRLNIMRSITAVWQEYQGLGLLGGMAHAADLPRQIILFALSYFFEARLLRYIWTFAMLVIGPVGVYFLIKKIFKENLAVKISAITAGFYYLFNLATVQYFYTTYESFVSFYGFLPWLVFGAIKYLKTGSTKNLFYFFIISILATAAFYVQTMFIVYMIVLGIFVLENLLWNENRKQQLLNSIRLFIIIIAANSFWLLPSLYFTATNSDVVKQSKINHFATIETQLMNEDKGNIKDISFIKGFWFDYSDLGENGEFDYLMKPWRDHLAQENMEYLGYSLFVVAVIGAVLALLKKNNWRITPIILIALSYFMLAGSNPPTGVLFDFISEHVPLFDQAFRSVFTKWSGVAALSYAIGLGGLVYVVSDLFKNRLKLLGVLAAVPIIAGSSYFVKPVFEGQLVMPNTRIAIPKDYFSSFDYLNSQTGHQRIAFFPMQDFYGWNFYDWGHRGSGFIWYGIKHPVLDRAFDVWSGYNETFYHQASDAFYANDFERLVSVFDKYDVTKVYIDHSVVVPHKDDDILKTEELVTGLVALGAELEFQRDFIQIVDVGNLTGDPEWVYSELDFVHTNNSDLFTRRDNVFEKYGNYISSDGGALLFPFQKLYNEKVSVSYGEPADESRIIELNANLESGRYNLMIPGIQDGTLLTIPLTLKFNNTDIVIIFDNHAKIINGDEVIELPGLPNLGVQTTDVVEEVIVSIGNDFIQIRQGEEVSLPVVLRVDEPINIRAFDVTRKSEHDLGESFNSVQLNTCWTRENSEPLMEQDLREGVLSVTTRDAVGCTAYKIGEFSESELFDIRLPYKSENGSRPHFCILAEGEDYNCKSDEIFYNTGHSNEWTYVERKLILDGNKNYWFEISARPPDEMGEMWKISYQAPEVVTYPIAADVVFDSSIWDEVKGGTGKSITVQDEFKLEIATKQIDADFISRGKILPRNCDVFERGEITKKLVDNTVSYSASNYASTCDHVSMNELGSDSSYLLRLVGSGENGRAQKIYLHNRASNRVDIESLLGVEEFDTTFSVFDWDSLDIDSYVLYSELRSFGETNQATLESASFYYFPVDWVGNFVLDSESNRFISGANVINSKKSDLYRYETNLQVTKDQSVFALSQGYVDGWRAYSFRNESCKLLVLGCEFFKANFPWFFGQELEHVKVNGWANGWLIKDQIVDSEQLTVDREEIPVEDQLTANGSQRTDHIIIVYWPQYLEFIGLALIPLTLAGFSVLMIRSKKKDKKLIMKVLRT